MHIDSDILIIGGGLSGLSTGCYAQMNGWQTHIVEHNQELGGVCTAWLRDKYLIDGCIHWLIGGAEGGMFRPLFEELGVIDAVELDTIDLLHRYEAPLGDRAVEMRRDLDQTREDLLRLSPGDRKEIDRLLEAIDALRSLPSPFPEPKLASIQKRVAQLWDLRNLAGPLVHYRGNFGSFCEKNIRGTALRRYLQSVLSPEMPAIFFPVLLQQLADGQLSRPKGGSGLFRDAIADRYRDLGGAVTLNATVEEILLEGDRAVGVRLADGTQLGADRIVSTASTFETHLHLLGGRTLDRATRKQLDQWPLFNPIVLLSLGVDMPLADLPSTLIVDQSRPLRVGSRDAASLYMRIYNDDPSFAPEGECVVQTMLDTNYDWWASRGARYHEDKQDLTNEIIRRMEERIPGIRTAIRMTDLATPLTFWRHARSWRGAYEGWLPTPDTYRAHLSKEVAGVKNLYLAGQWLEPGGGVPIALMSGRQLVQNLCDRDGRDFETRAPTRAMAEPSVAAKGPEHVEIQLH